MISVADVRKILEENKAIEYSVYSLGLPLVTLFILLVVRILYLSIARNEFEVLKAVKNLISYACILGLVYVPLRPVVSSWIIFLNSNLGEPAEIRISGIVKYKQDYIRKTRDRELHIFEIGTQKMYELDVDAAHGSNYAVGQPFNNTLYRGLFGLLYKK